MSKNLIQAIILAAGKSTRFNTGNSKLLEKLCGQEMILYPIKLFEHFNLPITLVIGYQAADIKNLIKTLCKTNISFATQAEQKGTGDALLATKNLWVKDHILVMNGDMPHVNKEIISQLLQKTS